MTGKPMSEWLNKITDDQNLNDLDEVTLTRLDGLRRWFASRVLGFNINTGYYDDDNGVVILGPRKATEYDSTPNADYDATSAGARTLTVPAGHKYFLRIACTENDTRAPTLNVVATINAEACVLVDTGAGSAIQAEINYVVGAAGANTNVYSAGTGFWMNAGDTLTITQTNFVAADAVTYSFIFDDYVLGV